MTFDFDDDQPVHVEFTDGGLQGTFSGTLREFCEQHPSVTFQRLTFLFEATTYVN